MASRTKPRVLCVDDEPAVLEGLSLHLGRKYQLFTETSGAAGLATLGAHAPIAAVVSDMRMPGMDGATFLTRAREQHPETTRMLLTGQADIKSAIAAVNEGQIFQFLTKPCPPEALLRAVAAGVEQHRLVTAEKVLLEQTLHGAVKTLTDILAYSNPAAFGRAVRVKQYTGELSDALGMPDRWQVEVAAMLSQMICATLPQNTVETLYYGKRPTKKQQNVLKRLPTLTAQLVGNIPRLEKIRDAIRHQDDHFDKLPHDAPEAAALLKIALDFDVLEAQGMTVHEALREMSSRDGWYEPDKLATFRSLRSSETRSVQQIRAEELAEGMMLAEDLRNRDGALVVARGIALSEWTLAKVRSHYRDGSERVSILEVGRVITHSPHDDHDDRDDHHDRHDRDDELPAVAEEMAGGTASIEEIIKRFMAHASAEQLEASLGSPMVRELAELQAHPELSGEEVQRILERNQELAIEVLRVSNSPAYQRREQVTNLRDAIVRLGNRTVLNIAQTLSHREIFQAKNEAYDDLFDSLWQETQFQALFAREVARALLSERLEVDVEDVFLITLFHNIGEIAILRHVATVHAADDVAAEDWLQLAQGLARHHEDIGERILRTWRMPKVCARLAGCHHDVATRHGRPPLRQADHLLVHLLNVACHAAASNGFQNDCRSHYGNLELEASMQEVGLVQDDLANLAIRAMAML